MQALKYTIITSIVFAGLFFLFGPEVIPTGFQPQEILDKAADSDVIIIFNSGGWGNTPLEEAQDFAPIIEGVQETLNEWGYKSVIIPYNRTKSGFIGKIRGVKEFFSSFDFSSEILAKDVEFLAEKLPDKKIIMAGLSNGASFVNRTYEKVTGEVKNSVYVITAGTPFWEKPFESDNVLQLDNAGRDTLVEGDVSSLFSSLIKTPFSKRFEAPGHDYFWSSSDVNSKIVSFLRDKFH
jgi:hypothetical protein